MSVPSVFAVLSLGFVPTPSARTYVPSVIRNDQEFNSRLYSSTRFFCILFTPLTACLFEALGFWQSVTGKDKCSYDLRPHKCVSLFLYLIRHVRRTVATARLTSLLPTLTPIPTLTKVFQGLSKVPAFHRTGTRGVIL